MKIWTLLTLGMFGLLLTADAALADQGPPHLVYERKLNPKRVGLYYRAMSSLTRGTPLQGPIYVPTQPLNIKPNAHRIPTHYKWVE